MWGTALKIAAPLIGGLFGGGGDSSSGANVPKLNQFDMKNLDQYQLNKFNGNNNIETRSIFDQLESNVMEQLQGDNLGMSDSEMSTYMDQINSNLSEQRDEGVSQKLASMNDRGVLSSTMTGDAMSDVNQNFSDALTDAQANMFLQNEQMKRNQYNNAMSQGLGLSQYDTGLQQQNFQNDFNIWQANNNVTQQNLGNKMDVMGFNNNAIGNQYNMQTGERAYQDQQKQQKWQNVGAGFQMGSDLAEGTELGSGWGGAIGSLVGGMFS